MGTAEERDVSCSTSIPAGSAVRGGESEGSREVRKVGRESIERADKEHIVKNDTIVL